MESKSSFLKKVVGLVICLCAGILIAGTIGIKAASDESGEIVRVSGSKELKKAMDDPAVGTILFTTEKFMDLTIKPNENAKKIALVIDAEHAKINNKALFEGIEIVNARSYVENVSGNSILLGDPGHIGSFTVAKNKTVANLGLKTLSAYTNLNNYYVLRKGAKVENIVLFCYDSVNKGNVISRSDEITREASIEYTDTLGEKRSYMFKIDERGRIVRMVSDGANKFDYSFTYDKCGKISSLTGTDEDDGNCKEVRTYKDNLLMKVEMETDVRRIEESYTYDEKGNMTERNIATFLEDGEYVESYAFTYDSKGRIAAEYFSDGNSKSVYVHTYNSKGFLVKSIGTFYTADGELKDTEVRIYKLNKAGNLVRYSVTRGGVTETTEITYDDIGFEIDRKETTDNGTGRVDLELTDEEFRELNHKLFLANQPEEVFKRHSSQAVTCFNDFPLTEDEAYLYYSTPDSLYQEANDWIQYDKDRMSYQLTDMNDPDKANMWYMIDLRDDWSPWMEGYMPSDENSWMDYEHDHIFSIYTEDGKLHLISRYDEELSRYYAEERIGAEYEGESYVTEVIFDENTLDYLKLIATKELNGTSEVVSVTFIDYDLPEPTACKAVRAAFNRTADNMAKVTFVMNPGTKNEIKKTAEVPYNCIVGYRVDEIENLQVFYDRECTKPVTERWDRMSDLTRYFTYKK